MFHNCLTVLVVFFIKAELQAKPLKHVLKPTDGNSGLPYNSVFCQRCDPGSLGGGVQASIAVVKHSLVRHAPPPPNPGLVAWTM